MHSTTAALSRFISAAGNVFRRSLRAVPRRLRLVRRRSSLPTAAPASRRRQAARLPPRSSTCSVGRGLVQISQVRADDLVTVDGVPVCVMVNLAWSTERLPQHTGVGAADPEPWSLRCNPPCSCAPSHEQLSTTLQQLATTGLRQLVRGCGLAELLCDIPRMELQLRRNISALGADLGISVHVLRIREISVPGAVQAAGDARQLLAMRTSRSRHLAPTP